MNYKLNINPDKNLVKNFIVKNHYLRNCPSGKYYFSLENENNETVGVCLFGKPSRQNISVDGCEDIIELSRFCLKDEEPKNTESYFLGCCIRWLKQNTDHEAIVTFADSTEGHQGTIYKASNFHFLGFTHLNYHYEDKNGNRIHKRKIWNHAKNNNISEKKQSENDDLIKIKELKKSKFAYFLIPEKDKRFIIYFLIDPRTNEVRYVGKSTKGRQRYKDHIRSFESKREEHFHKSRWMKELKNLNLQPIFELVEIYKTKEELSEAEQFYISYLRFLGVNLTNLTDGGEGTIGYKHTETTKDKIREKALERGPTNLVSHNKKVHIFENAIEKRKCSKCEQYKSLDNFCLNKKTNNYQGLCKNCDKLRKQESRKLKPDSINYVKLSPEEYKQSRIEAARKGGLAIANSPEKRAAISQKKSKPVVATSCSSSEILEFPSALKAKESGYHNKLIGDAIKSGRPYKGYTWTFKV